MAIFTFTMGNPGVILLALTLQALLVACAVNMFYHSDCQGQDQSDQIRQLTRQLSELRIQNYVLKHQILHDKYYDDEDDDHNHRDDADASSKLRIQNYALKHQLLHGNEDYNNRDDDSNDRDDIDASAKLRIQTYALKHQILHGNEDYNDRDDLDASSNLRGPSSSKEKENKAKENWKNASLPNHSSDSTKKNPNNISVNKSSSRKDHKQQLKRPSLSVLTAR